ncbi:DUF397 domain-containing protein [Streptosporangium sp. KLBMP 9127]|nr:DUF397 domain-containing protein [Streptosporangium sp. KLBMP 9127]
MITEDGWTTASGNGGNCVEAKLASLAHVVILRESADEINPGVYVSLHQWRQFLDDVKTGQFKPTLVGDTGMLAIDISDWPGGTTARPVHTTQRNWEIFTMGVREGVFDSLTTEPVSGHVETVHRASL